MGSFGCAFDSSNPLAGGATGPTPGALVPPDGGRVTMPPGPADDPNPTSTTPDAGTRGPTLSPDASIAAPPPAGTPCWDRPYEFSAPERLDGLSSTSDEAEPTFSPDGLTLVFSSKRGGNWDLWLAERPTTDAEFGVPRLLAGYATGASERAATISPDGQRIYFISDRVESGMQAVDVWTSPFPSGNPTRSTLSTARNDERVLLSGDDHFALVAADDKLYASARMSASQPWATPSLQVMISGCAGCKASAISPDGKTLVVTRDIRDPGGPGPMDDEDQSDLTIVTRSDVLSPFGSPRAIGGVNDPRADDEDGALSPDGCWLYFASDRGGNADLYRARRN